MTVLVGGVFDLTHYGHASFLRRAAEFGDYLVVSVNRDEFVRRYKNKTPILTLEERMEMVRHLKGVDLVLENTSNEDWLPMLKKIRPDIVVTSTEWQHKDYYAQMGVTREQMDLLGIELCYIPHTVSISTTKILERIDERSFHSTTA